MTKEELKEILELHALWLKGDPKGKRANLEGANLRGANLKFANLYGADLRGANLEGINMGYANLEGAKGTIKVGTSSDGYDFFGVKHSNGVFVKAGCRWFTVGEAKEHWMETRKNTPLGEERLKFVSLIGDWASLVVEGD